ncbi:MAG: hydroxymethylbilane synthase [Caulobacterales bacterium]
MTDPFRIGARASPLSLAQTGQVRAALAAALGIGPDDAASLLPIVGMTTTGDRLQDGRLVDVGGKGLFTKELDEALLEGRIDLAVHSLKDLPSRLPAGLALVAVPERADPRDAFVSSVAQSLAALPLGAVVGTSSLRRQAQTLYARPDLIVVPFRGNVDTRLAKLASGQAQATFLAVSGLQRLDKLKHVASVVDPDECPPAPCQGALAITARADDTRAIAAALRLQKPDAFCEAQSERAFLAALDGSCRTPIAALARCLGGDQISFLGEVLRPDGSARWRRSTSGLTSDAAEIGREIGLALKAEAGDLLAWRA